MSSFTLKVLTPENEIFSDTVDQVNIDTPEGQIGIFPNHIALMSKVSPGELQIKKSGKLTRLAIGEGFLQVKDNILTVLADLAVEEKDIDEKAVEEAKKRAEKALEEKLSNEEYAETLAILEKSLAQLRVKRRHRS